MAHKLCGVSSAQKEISTRGRMFQSFILQVDQFVCTYMPCICKYVINIRHFKNYSSI